LTPPLPNILGASDADRLRDPTPKHNCPGATGMPQVIRPDGTYRSQLRFGLYRWHIMDPIRFETDLRVTIQVIGWRTEKQNADRRYLPLQDDIASVAYWYQAFRAIPCTWRPRLP
jgi:hypothetical protein